jgi:hypothetical protein
VRWPPAWELVSWNNELVVRQSSASQDVNTEAEEATGLEAVTRRQPLKVQQNSVMNCRVCELATALQLFTVTVYKSLINPIA